LSIKQAVKVCPLAYIYQVDFTLAGLESAASASLKRSWTLDKQRAAYVRGAEHVDPNVDVFDYEDAAKRVFEVNRSAAESRKVLDGYQKLLNFGSTGAARAANGAMQAGHDTEAHVRDWLHRASNGIPQPFQDLHWVDGTGKDVAQRHKKKKAGGGGDGGGPTVVRSSDLPPEVDPIEFVANSLGVDSGIVTFAAAQPGVKLAVGSSVGGPVGIRGVASSTSGRATRKSDTIIIVEVKYGKPTPSATELQVQGQMLAVNNGAVYATAQAANSVVAFAAIVRAPLIEGKRIVELRRVPYDPAVQQRLLHYAKLNVAVARLLLPQLFAQRYQEVVQGAASAPPKRGALCFAKCNAQFRLAYRHPKSKVSDVCSCGSKIMYTQEGVPPPATTTASKDTCEWNHVACPGVYLVKGQSLHTGHYESRRESETRILRHAGASSRVVDLTEMLSPPTVTARIVAKDFQENLPEGYVPTSRAIREIKRKDRGNSTEADKGIPGLLLELHKRQNPYLARQAAPPPKHTHTHNPIYPRLSSAPPTTSAYAPSEIS
jgi:hypothetical protein